MADCRIKCLNTSSTTTTAYSREPYLISEYISLIFWSGAKFNILTEYHDIQRKSVFNDKYSFPQIFSF